MSHGALHHLFVARDGGVLVRAGQTEGAVDLARMAGLKPAGRIVAILGIGLYPRIMTDSYRASMEALVQRENAAVTRLIHPSANDLIRRPTMAMVSLLQAPRLPAPGPA